MVKVYIASPFFDEAGIERGNVEKVKAILEGMGVDFFSPMDSDQNLAVGDNKQIGSRQWSIETFMSDVKAINACDIVLGLYYGNYSDSGTAWELGYAFGTQKPVVLVHLGEESNLMCHEGAHANITLQELYKYNFRKLPQSFYTGRMF